MLASSGKIDQCSFTRNGFLYLKKFPSWKCLSNLLQKDLNDISIQQGWQDASLDASNLFKPIYQLKIVNCLIV